MKVLEVNLRKWQRKARKALKDLGKEDCTDAVILWYMVNQRKMTLKEFDELLEFEGDDKE